MPDQNDELHKAMSAMMETRSAEGDELFETLKTFHGEHTALYIQSMNRAIYMLGKQTEVAHMLLDKLSNREAANVLKSLFNLMTQMGATHLGQATRLALVPMAPENVRNDAARLEKWRDGVHVLGQRMLKVHFAAEQDARKLMDKFRGSTAD